MIRHLIWGGVGLACLFGCSPALNWREVRPVDADALVALFPCKPEHQSRQVRLPELPGDPVTMHVLACEADGARWALSYFHAGDPERRMKGLGLLSRTLDANLHAAWPGAPASSPPPKDLGPTTVPGMADHPDARTWWQSGHRPLPGGQTAPVQVQAWHFSHGLTVYQASVWQETLSSGDPRLTTFAGGFNFPR